MGCNDLVMD